VGRNKVWLRRSVVCFALPTLVALFVAGPSTELVAAKQHDPCSKRAFRLQFWPNGTPGNPRPHLVVYPGAHGRTRQQDRLGYADETGLRGAFVCGQPREFAPRVHQMRRKIRTDSAAQLVCRPGRVRSFSVPTSQPSAGTPYDGMVQVRGADRRILYAIFSATYLSEGGGPVLQYDSRVCSGRRIRCTNESPPCRLTKSGVLSASR
jgi:hypothetical protein